MTKPDNKRRRHTNKSFLTANFSRHDRTLVIVLMVLVSASLFISLILYGFLNEPESDTSSDIFPRSIRLSNSPASKAKPHIPRPSENDSPIPIFLFQDDALAGVERLEFPVVSTLSKIRTKERKIKLDESGSSKRDSDEHIDEYYAFDDDVVRDEGFPGRTGFCRRPSWQRFLHPNCNLFHEGDISSDSSSYFSNGYYRDVWGVKHDDDLAVLKMNRNKHDFDFSTFEMTRNDALVMERLTSSPRIVDIYGHCGTSVLTERLAEELEEYIVPEHSRDLEDSEDVDPQNDYTVAEKLQIALAMAESIADLHGFKDGVIVHDDIQLCQWLRARDGSIKLNDFNRAEVMYWDEKQDKYCVYRNGAGYGNYRSPEEYNDNPLNEKIDIYSMGNNIYGLLTGLWVYYENEDDKVMRKMNKNGELPYVDPRYRRRSYGEKSLVEIMEKCWEFFPEDRPDIFEIVDLLKAAIAKNPYR